MAAGGGGAFATPAYPGVALTAKPLGGWTPVGSPHAVESGGTLFFGYSRGNGGGAGDACVHSYVGGVTSAAFVLHAALAGHGPPDDHGAPSLLVRSPDSRIVALFPQQGDTVLRKRISTSPLDVSAWDAEADHTPGGSNYLYPVPVQLSAEGPGRIYVFWKDFAGTGTTYIRQSTSDDGGATLSASVRLWGSANAFYAIASDDTSRMDYVTTDIAPGAGGVRLYHFYQAGGQLYGSDGTPIATPIPIGPSDATLVYSGGGDAFPYSVAYDGSGHPVVACAEFGATVAYFEERWSGSAWVRHDIATTPAALAGNEPPGICQDGPDRVVLGRSVGGGVFEMFDYRTADAGVTWAGTQITYGSGADIPQTPVLVKGHGAGLAVLWETGSWAGDDDYSTYTTGTP